MICLCPKMSVPLKVVILILKFLQIKVELHTEIALVKVLVIVIIVFKSYSSTYCFLQGMCFISSTVRVTTFKYAFSKITNRTLKLNLLINLISGKNVSIIFMFFYTYY